MTYAGTRGATSAEYFLKAGYAVIFLHRLHSLRPFSRHYSHSLNPFLDLLQITESHSPTGQPLIQVDSKHTPDLIPILQAYHVAHQRGTLLSVEFSTVNEYLWLLRDLSRPMATLGRKGLFYLAAAVSDFFLPDDKVVCPFPFHSPTCAERRPSIKYNPTKGHCLWRWIKYRKCSDR